jgi:parallel beta-helix repeat protein
MKLFALLLLAVIPLRVNADTKLPPNQIYHQPIVITADNLTLDCNGSTFLGDGIGVGLLIQNHSRITVRNCKVHGFDVGMYVVGGQRFLFENNDFSDNYLDDGYPIEDLKPIPHGGMLLNGVTQARIQNSAANHNVAGIQVLNSTRVKLYRNTTNNNRGWGIYLYQTSASQVYTNTANFNNRNCWSGPNSGCGSAGIVLTNHADRNKIAWNTLTADGDGIYQGNTPETASNDNEISRNTIARSAANGIEATYSFRNYIHDNTFTDDNYGAWLGYAQYVRFERNVIRGAHVYSVQHDNAQFSRYVGNTFDGAGVLLQPVAGGICQGNLFDRNFLANAEIQTPGCQ